MRPSTISRLLFRFKGRDTEDHASDERGDTMRSRKASFNSLPIEILQQIFESLKFLVLLKCRCVCSKWYSCIPGSSPLLQQALFLPAPRARMQQPTSARRLTLYFEIYTNAPPNYPPYSTERNLNIRNVNKVTLAYQTDGIHVHPFIGKIDRFLVARIPDLDHISRQPDVNNFHFAHLKSKSGLLLQPDDVPLWKGMFATDPPVTTLRVQFRYINRDFGGIDPRVDRNRCVLEDSEGALFGDLWHVLEKQVMGLLRLETMRQIDARPEDYVHLAGLREAVSDTTSPV